MECGGGFYRIGGEAISCYVNIAYMCLHLYMSDYPAAEVNLCQPKRCGVFEHGMEDSHALLWMAWCESAFDLSIRRPTCI